MKRASTRREFIAKSSVAGAGALAGMNIVSIGGSISDNLLYKNDENTISVKPRYYRWHVDKGMDWIEANTGYARLNWKIPVSQAAVVLVDVWQRHYIKDPEARAEVIINERMLPLLRKLRKSGIKIIHAPSPEVAVTHPNWVRIQTKEQVFAKHDVWPPAEFLSSKGNFKPFEMPSEPMEEVRNKMEPLTFHPKVLPQQGEPVVANGAELHEYLKQNKLLFLFYAGFNTNACIINRDYGTIRMRDRGYKIILVRDCTTGMESKDTQATLAQTNSTILNLEMFGCFTVTSEDLIDGISA
ncbi:MAG TPA: isochorismatase family protein [Bacteroidales bacterium]|nr:isochorismatase family protein [Bacteroidales bacterium]